MKEWVFGILVGMMIGEYAFDLSLKKGVNLQNEL